MESAFGLAILRTLEDVRNRREMALLYDMKVGVVRQIQSASRVVANVREALAIAHAASMRVFFTRHMSLPRELMGSFHYRMAVSRQRVASPDQVQP